MKTEALQDVSEKNIKGDHPSFINREGLEPKFVRDGIRDVGVTGSKRTILNAKPEEESFQTFLGLGSRATTSPDATAENIPALTTKERRDRDKTAKRAAWERNRENVSTLIFAL